MDGEDVGQAIADVISDAVVNGARGVAIGVEMVGQRLREMAQALTDHEAYTEAMERGHHCGNRTPSAMVLSLWPEHEHMAVRIAHRRKWRRCKRYWTQVKRPINSLPRSERR